MYFRTIKMWMYYKMLFKSTLVTETGEIFLYIERTINWIEQVRPYGRTLLWLRLFSRRCEAVLGLHGLQIGLLLVRVHPLEGLVWLVVEDDEIAVANVEAAEMVASVLCVKNVFVNDESCTTGLWCVPSANHTNKDQCISPLPSIVAQKNVASEFSYFLNIMLF